MDHFARMPPHTSRAALAPVRATSGAVRSRPHDAQPITGRIPRRESTGGRQTTARFLVAITVACLPTGAGLEHVEQLLPSGDGEAFVADLTLKQYRRSSPYRGGRKHMPHLDTHGGRARRSHDLRRMQHEQERLGGGHLAVQEPIERR